MPLYTRDGIPDFQSWHTNLLPSPQASRSPRGVTHVAWEHGKSLYCLRVVEAMLDGRPLWGTSGKGGRDDGPLRIATTLVLPCQKTAAVYQAFCTKSCIAMDSVDRTQAICGDA